MKRKRFLNKRIIKLGWPFLVLFVLSLLVIRERGGVAFNNVVTEERNFDARLYEVKDEEFSQVVTSEVDCLVISDSTDAQCNEMMKQLEAVFDGMCIQYELVDLANESFPELAEYEKIVVATSTLYVLENKVLDLCAWVEEGGQLMNVATFQNDDWYEMFAPYTGVETVKKGEYIPVTGIRVLNDFMLNAQDREFFYENENKSAINLTLKPDCTVYLEDPNTELPLLWSYEYGDGLFVMNNQVLAEKSVRGILCASYSLMGDICAYPVINASTFYLDDFPSPVPSGDGKYISEDYGVSISTFYSNIWWPDMLKLQEKYGIIHSGFIIVDYSDQVEGKFEKYDQTERFTFFGNMLLNQGGELGFHGYNHMPLTLDNYDYMGMYEEYNHWPTTEDMKNAITVLLEFSKELFPDARFSVYVPPSNILSEEGRTALKETWDDLLVIASLYNEDSVAYSQEFEIAEDGLIETPRLTSGCTLTEYMMLSAFSELTFQYVQSHFLHPDDVLDEHRGAALGWEKMYEGLLGYIDYIYTAAPSIRNVSATGMGEAVREYDKLSVRRELSEDALTLYLGGFYEEAYLMLRINEGEIGTVTGGELSHVSGNFYLLHATDDEVIVKLH